MSSQQTVRITTTETSNTSALILNIGYLATPPGILKVLQVVNILLDHSVDRTFYYRTIHLNHLIDFRVHLRWNYFIQFQ